MRILGSALVAATVVFIWGFVYWALTPMGVNSVRGPDNAPAVQEFLDKNLAESGMYVVPFSENPDTDTQYHQAHTQGPLALIQFRKQGAEPMAPAIMIQGWLHGFVTFIVMAIAVRLAVPEGSFGARFMVALGGGVAGSLLATYGGPIWWYMPWGFATTLFVYQAVAWLLGAIVLAMILRSSSPRPDPSRL